jgi:predicted permease
MRSLIAAVRSLLSRARFEREMREELAQHVQHRADDLVRTGMPRDEAVRHARLEFGSVEAYKEQCRDESGFAPLRVLHGLSADLKIAARRLAATPVFTIFAILSLAVGIGVTTAVFSVVDRIFWRDAGLRDPHTLALIISPEGADDGQWAVSAPDLDDFRRSQTSFTRVTGAYVIHPAVASHATTETQRAEAVDGDYFAMLDVRAHIGRVLQQADHAQGAPVVVLGYELWRTRFGADPNVLGQTVRLSGHLFEIVGVAPESFRGASPGPFGSSLWIPLSRVGPFDPGNPLRLVPGRERRRFTVVGRLKPGVSQQQASAEASAFAAALDQEYPRTITQTGRPTGRGWRVATLEALRKPGDDLRGFGLLVFGLITMVLVVACTNLANLILARGAGRQHEFAVRRALGAPRWRLVREQSAESLLLALGGAASSWLVLAGLIRALDIEVPMSRAWFVSVQPELNTTALALAAGVLLLSLLVFGLEPALQLTRKSEVRDDLASGAGSVGVPKAKRQRALLRWQVAISTAFFIIATLCVRYLVSEARYDSGMDLDRMAVASIDFNIQRRDETRARATLERILARIRQQPGVETASFSSGLPFGTTITPRLLLYTAEKPLTTDGGGEDATLVIATPDFFRTTGISILRGRAFDERDVAGGRYAMVLSESTARRLFGSADVVGRQVDVRMDTRLQGLDPGQPIRTATIIGVAEDTDTTHFRRRSGDTAYLPAAQEYSPWITVVARSEDPSDAVAAIRRSVREVDPDLAISQVASGHAMLAGPHVLLRGMSIVALSLGGVTLLLAMAGLYGVQSHIVAHRTREIGVRMSLGATAAQVRQMVLKDGYKPVLQGLALGLFFGVVGRAIVRAVLVARLDVVDPWMLLLVPVPMLLAAFLACFLPARRASRVDPNVALRHL